MNDQELDDLLRRGAAPPPAGLSEEIASLGERTRARVAHEAATPRPARRRPWFRRRPVLAGGVLAAVVALSASASLTAYQLSIPPFQTLEPGLQRVPTPIPVDYEGSDGTSGRCLVFMELAHLRPGQLQRIDDAVASQDWSPERQRALVGRSSRAGTPRTEADVFTDTLDTRLYRFARRVVPGLSDDPSEGGPSFSGYGSSCRDVSR